MKALKYIVWIGLLLLLQESQAQTFVNSGGKRFEYFRMQDFVAGQRATAFLQDRLGYIWVGSEQGLTRYDGLEFKPVEMLGDKAGLLQSCMIECFYEDREGVIWIGTRWQGVFRYDPQTLQVSQLLFEPEVFETYNRNHINCFAEDASGYFCIGTANGFYRLKDPYGENWQNYVEYQPRMVPKELMIWAEKSFESQNTYAAVLHDGNQLMNNPSFEFKEPTDIIILGVGVKRPPKFKGMWSAKYILDERRDTVWQMDLLNTIEIDNSINGASRAQLLPLTLPAGKYEIVVDFPTEWPSYYNNPYGVAVFKSTKEDVELIQNALREVSKVPDLNEQNIESIYTDVDGVTWLIGGGGLTKMTIPDLKEPDQIKFENFQPSWKGPERSRSVHALDFAEADGDKVVFCGNRFDDDGIWGEIILDQYDPKTGNWTDLPTDLIPSSQTINQVHITSDGALWMGTRGIYSRTNVGLYIKEQYGKTTYHQLYGPDDEDLSASINFIAADNHQGIWIGGDNGLFHYDPNFSLFTVKRLITKNQGQPLINDIELDQNGQVWMGTRGKGVFRLDPETELVEQFSVSPTGLRDSNIIDITIDQQGLVWVATANGYIHQIDPNTLAAKATILPDNPKAFQNNLPYEPSLLINGVQNTLLVGTRQGAFLQYDQKKEDWINIFEHPGDTFKIYEYGVPQWIYQLSPTESLSGTSSNVLLKIRFPEEGNYNRYEYEVLSTDIDVLSMKKDQNGTIWIVGNYGLFYLDSQLKNPIAVEASPDELTDLAIDVNGDLWLQSRNSLYHYKVKEERFIQYDARFGLSRYNNRTNVVKALPDGRILASSGLGYTIFNPNNIYRQEYEPTLILERIKVANKFLIVNPDGPLKQSISSAEQLELKSSQNDITLYFAALALDQGGATPYSYRFKLEGYDDQFKRAWDNRSAVYTNLSPGHYTFMVQASRDGKSWMTTDRNLMINIAPPWYQTIWAYLSFIILVGVITYTVYRMLLNNRLKREEANALREMDALKTKLYTNITHEFRTPLTIIIGMARQIQERPGSWAKEGTEMIIRNGYQLLNQVNQMLDLSKLESGKLALKEEEMDVIAFAKYISESFHSFAETKGIQLHFLSDIPSLYTPMDKTRLQQILSNLLSNAIKFTPERGHVYLQMQKVGGNQVKIEVRDTGRGIAQKDLEHLFERFYQADNLLTRKGEGTGIGLALTHELVKLMNGTIDVRSAVGKGSTFSVCLPIREQANGSHRSVEQVENLPFPVSIPSATAMPEEGTTIPSLKVLEDMPDTLPLILIAEDNADVVRYLRSCLEADYRIMIAPDGLVAEEMAKEHTPDLVISDVMMPRQDGFSFCKAIKSNIATSHIPVIMLTAKADTDSKLIGLEGGADAYLAKPFDPRELQIRIRKLLELRRNLQKHYLGVADQMPAALVEEEDTALPQEDAFVTQLKTFVLDNLDNTELSVEDLCKEIMLSHSQLHRKLTALTGLSTNAFIRHIRLKEAKELLKNPALSVTAIAYDTGFNDPSYFGRVFKKEFGLTPSKFREKHNDFAG